MAGVVRRIINTSLAPKAIGPYSQAVLIERTLYISGQLGLDAATGNFVEGGVAAQTRKALENMGHILKEVDANYSNVVKTTVLLADINDFSTVNDVYSQFFTENYPARAAYQVAALPKLGRIEIEAIAIIGELHTH